MPLCVKSACANTRAIDWGLPDTVSIPRHLPAPRDGELKLAVIFITIIVTVLLEAPTGAIFPMVIVDGSCLAYEEGCGDRGDRSRRRPWRASPVSYDVSLHATRRLVIPLCVCAVLACACAIPPCVCPHAIADLVSGRRHRRPAHRPNGFAQLE